MCLVSYWRTASGEVILTSNRDEAPQRSVNQIQKEKNKDYSLIYPQDTQGGSWFFVSSKKSAAIILNGAFKMHHRQDKYKLSRGIMLKEFFAFENLAHFLNQYDFQDIEPFTMIVFENHKLYEFRWDGALKYIEILETEELHVWSSCTLYTSERQKLREDKFIELFNKENEDVNHQSLKAIHLKGKVGNPEYDFLMNIKDIVKTISVSQVRIKEKQLEFSFENLLSNEVLHQIVAI